MNMDLRQLKNYYLKDSWGLKCNAISNEIIPKHTKNVIATWKLWANENILMIIKIIKRKYQCLP